MEGGDLVVESAPTPVLVEFYHDGSPPRGGGPWSPTTVPGATTEAPGVEEPPGGEWSALEENPCQWCC